MGAGSTGLSERRPGQDALPGAGRGRPRWEVVGAHPALAPTVTALLALLHALLVAPTYHVGSFDDDASYVMTARALASGTGLTGVLPAGYPLIGTYPPGFAFLLSPLALVSGSATWPYRVLVLAFFLALFPVVDRWLRRAGSPPWLRWAVLGLLALNPVAATYATMVMAEAPFLVALVALFLLARRWGARGAPVLSLTGAGVVLVAAALLWLKQAGLGLVVGLVLWLALRRAWRHALALAALVALACAPVLVLRAVVGTPLAGSRYTSEIGGNAGLAAIPDAIRQYLTTALPRSILPLTGPPGLASTVVAVTVAVFVGLGALLWLRRRADDPSCVMVAVYLASTLVYPFVNERRIVLVLPVVLAWFAVGAGAVVRGVAGAGSRIRPGLRLERPLAVLLAVLVVVPLVLQLDRNYRLGRGQETSQMLGSPYLGFVTAVTGPGDVVETPYVWTTSLGTGRRTLNGLFVHGCDPAAMRTAAQRNRAGIVLDGAFNTPPPSDSCYKQQLEAASWAVPLYRTPLDDATVYQLIGPGTEHPTLRDAVQGPGTAATASGATSLTWTWGDPQTLDQLSLAAAAPETGQAAEVRLEWQDPQHRWHRAAAAPGSVGPAEDTPCMLWRPERPLLATAVRVVVVGGTGITAGELHALTGATP
jgi:Glycosyltransferase family 87